MTFGLYPLVSPLCDQSGDTATTTARISIDSGPRGDIGFNERDYDYFGDLPLPVLIALVGLIVAAGYWAWRIRMAKDALNDVAGVASDVLSAARRLGFRRKANVHPVESVDEPELAIAGASLAYLDLAAMPTAEDLANLKSVLQSELAVSELKADELLIVARWLVNECKGADAGMTRLTKRLQKLDPAGFQQLLAVLGKMNSSASPSPRQRDALDEVARIFRLT